jgi:hypothetical protein
MASEHTGGSRAVQCSIGIGRHSQLITSIMCVEAELDDAARVD